MDPEEDRPGYVLGGLTVCASHFEEPFLQEWVEAQASYDTCDFCERGADDPFAVDAESLGELVLAGLERAWGDYNDEMVPWGMGYDGALTTRELLTDEGVTFEDRLLGVLAEALPDRAWVQRDFFRLTPFQRLRSGWEEFTRAVKHEARYFFVLQASDEEDVDDMSPMQVLRELGEAVEQAGLIADWKAGTPVYRARPHQRDERPQDAWELAALPAALAERAAANRMSAAGVPMFYGADGPDVARKETVSACPEPPEATTTGHFRLLTDMRVLDLSSGVEVPSLFDPELGDQRPVFAFLRGFVDDAAKDVSRDGLEHVGYVPTQVVCEYFKAVFRTSAGERVDGIAYPSRQASGGVCVVLFVGNDEVANADGSRPPRPGGERWLGSLNFNPPARLELEASETRAEAKPPARSWAPLRAIRKFTGSCELR